MWADYVLSCALLLTSACISLVLSHSCLSIHASHIANVRMLSISLNVVLSVFHDLFTHHNPPRTSIFNRGGSHVFPWPQNGSGVHAQHAQCANAYFSAVSAVVSAHEALLKPNLESSDSTSYMYNLDFGSMFVCFVVSKTEQELLKVWSCLFKGMKLSSDSVLLHIIPFPQSAFGWTLLLPANCSLWPHASKGQRRPL